MAAFREITDELSSYDINSIFLTLGVMAAYFVGHISPARILAKINGIDITKAGSGNPGTTNVQRTLGNKAGLITLIVDVLKGVVVTFAGLQLVGLAYAMFVGIAVIVGHMWPLFFEFKGGKGVATTFGVLLVINWMYAVIILMVVLIVFAVTQRVSVGVIVGAVSAPIIGAFFDPWYVPWTLLIVIFILIKHVPNIKRIFSGTEPKVNFGSKGEKN